MNLLTTLRDTSLPTILVVVGIFFVLLAFVSQVGNIIKMPPQRQRAAAITGGLLLVLGVGLYLVPSSSRSQEVSLTPTATSGSATQQSSALPSQPSAPLPLHSQLTTAAWNALNRRDYTQAIEKAQECIDKFKTQALREQQEYTASGQQLPPSGEESEDEKKRIFSRGVLNSVATCYFIKGQALEDSNKPDEAREAYKAVQQFPDARTWDLGGFFWSPAKGASDHLANIQRNP